MTIDPSRRVALLSLGTAAVALPLLGANKASAATTQSHYIERTAKVGMFSLKSSELAQKKATNEHLKTFAGLEVGEQTAIAEILHSTDVKLPKMLEGKEAEMMKKLESLSGKEFDTAYLQDQINGHEELLEIQKPEAAMTKITVPVATAKVAEQTIKTHLVMLNDIKAMM